MALRQILHHPDPRLRQKALAVTRFDAALASLVDDMFETMYDAPGIGLAATQIDVQQRVIVVDTSSDKQSPLCFINPSILELRGVEEMEEGCLSVPGIFDYVERAQWVRIAAVERDGTPFEFEADGLLAVCIQHEMDHLDGKLFVDYLSQLKQTRIRKKLEKEQRLAG
ncbi:MAG: peptide deformylase [Gammaproteobacteria bacterium]|nr:peptide deformylase [Gammaproteobacteria bacterium]